MIFTERFRELNLDKEKLEEEKRFLEEENTEYEEDMSHFTEEVKMDAHIAILFNKERIKDIEQELEEIKEEMKGEIV